MLTDINLIIETHHSFHISFVSKVEALPPETLLFDEAAAKASQDPSTYVLSKTIEKLTSFNYRADEHQFSFLASLQRWLIFVWLRGRWIDAIGQRVVELEIFVRLNDLR